MSRRIATIALAALIVVVAAWYGLFLRPERSHLSAVKAAQTQAQTNVSSLQTQVGVLTAEETKVPLETRQLKELALAVPAGPALDELLDTLHAAAREANVRLTSVGTPEPSGWGTVMPAASAPANGPPSIHLSLSVTGGPQNILHFVTSLDHQPRLYVVDTFTLQYPVTNGRRLHQSISTGGTTALVVEAFYASPTSDVPVLQSLSPRQSGVRRHV